MSLSSAAKPLARYSMYGFLLGAGLMLTGLSLSRALISIGTAVIATAGVANLLSVAGRTALRQGWPHFLGLLLTGAVLLLAYIERQNLVLYSFQVKRYLPFVFLPLAWGLFARLSQAQAKLLTLVFIAGILALLAGTLIHYFLHYAAINEAVLHAKPVPILKPWRDLSQRLHAGQAAMSHIYFSLLAAVGCILALHWLTRARPVLHLRGERAGWAILFAVLLTGMHLVTARTGLLGFYGAFAVGMLIWLIRQRRWRLGVGVMIMGMAVPLVAYQLSSAVQNKVAITIKDLRNYAEGGDLSHWSLGRRLAVYETSWHMIRKRPFRGWEASFLQTHLIQQYEQEQFRLAREWRLLDPHNQYLMMLLITGVGGLVVFLSMFVLPWLRLRPHSFGAFSMFLALQLSGFLVESILNRQIGIGLFCFFYLFLQGLRYDASGTRTPADTSICSSHAE